MKHVVEGFQYKLNNYVGTLRIYDIQDTDRKSYTLYNGSLVSRDFKLSCADVDNLIHLVPTNKQIKNIAYLEYGQIYYCCGLVGYFKHYEKSRDISKLHFVQNLEHETGWDIDLDAISNRDFHKDIRLLEENSIHTNNKQMNYKDLEEKVTLLVELTKQFQGMFDIVKDQHESFIKKMQYLEQRIEELERPKVFGSIAPFGS